jgi:protease-4
MPLSEADLLIDRRRLKRQISFWRLAAILVALATIVGSALQFGRPLVGHGHIGRFSVTGVIADDRPRFEALREAARDPRLKAIVVRIDSPGGTVVASEELYRQLRQIAGRIPVVAVMGQTAASGGYMVALGADRIFAREGTITGSIGVLMQTADVTGLLQKLGVAMEQIKSSPLKAVPNPFEPLTDEGRRAVRAIIDDTHAMFVDMVAERRGLAPAEARRLADGRVYTGRQALGAGLVDALGGEESAIAWLTSARAVPGDLPVRDIKPGLVDPGGFDLSGLATRLIRGKSYLPERLTIDGLVAVWHPDLGTR